MKQNELVREFEDRVKRNNSFNREKWIQNISVKSVANPYLKEIILNYFVSEGYESAAVNFSEESGLKLGERNVEIMRTKDNIRKNLYEKKFEQVIEILNSHNEKILEESGQILLRLQLMIYCRMIEAQQFEQALAYIQEKAAKYLENGQHTELIEDHLLLLAVKDPQKGPRADLLSENRILDLNTLINKELNKRMDAEIITLMKLIKWMEKRLNKKNKVPHLADLSKLQFTLT